MGLSEVLIQFAGEGRLAVNGRGLKFRDVTGPRATSTRASANAAGVPKSAIKRAHFSFEGFDEHLVGRLQPASDEDVERSLRDKVSGPRLTDASSRQERGAGQIRKNRHHRLVSLGEIRLGVRLIAKQPILSAAVILGLASGICLATTAFTFRDALLNSPLPPADRDQPTHRARHIRGSANESKRTEQLLPTEFLSRAVLAFS